MTAAIRPARPDDAAAIRAVHRAAFPTPMEADLVEMLEADGDAVVSLVAKEGATIAGHIMLSRMTAEGDGLRYRALGLGPVGVLPAHQRKGVGAALIAEALRIARARAEEIVFLVGEPAYYGRFGFSTEAAAPFASPYAGGFFMALPLDDRALPASGKADYAPAFAAFEDAP